MIGIAGEFDRALSGDDCEHWSCLRQAITSTIEGHGDTALCERCGRAACNAWRKAAPDQLNVTGQSTDVIIVLDRPMIPLEQR